MSESPGEALARSSGLCSGLMDGLQPIPQPELEPTAKTGAPRRVVVRVRWVLDGRVIAAVVRVVERVEQVGDHADPLRARQRERLLEPQIHALRGEHVADSEEWLGRWRVDVTDLLA